MLPLFSVALLVSRRTCQVKVSCSRNFDRSVPKVSYLVSSTIHLRGFL